MWVDVWGAKVTRRYVPVIASVPPAIRTAVRGSRLNCPANCELTVQFNNPSVSKLRLRRLFSPLPQFTHTLCVVLDERFSGLPFPGVHETFMAVSKHEAIKTNLSAITRQQREIGKGCCSPAKPSVWACVAPRLNFNVCSVVVVTNLSSFDGAALNKWANDSLQQAVCLSVYRGI